MDAKTVRELVDIIKTNNNPTTPYDTTAEVIRVEDGTAWVHIPGGIDETPVAMTVNAREGDTVRVRVAGGQAWLTGSDTAPPTDDRMANVAQETAHNATVLAEIAEKDAERAALAADAAQESANQAAQAASDAQESADNAADAAADAMTQATTATGYANNALTQLSTVENVVGTLNWISEHGQYALTTDTEVVNGKLYFTRSGAGTTADPYVYTVVSSPASNPQTAGYYELTSVDEAVANYISTHLALTNEGLFLLMDNTGTAADGYKLKLTSTGASIIDAQGATVATYSTESVVGKATARNVKIGSSSVDIRNGQTVLASFGSDVRVGAQDAENIFIGSGNVEINAEDGSNAARITFLPNGYGDETRYGTRITNEYNQSFIDLDTAIGDNGFTNELELTASMDNYIFQATQGAEFNMASNIMFQLEDGSFVDIDDIGIHINQGNSNIRAIYYWDGEFRNTGNVVIAKSAPQLVATSTNRNSAPGQTVPDSGESTIGGTAIYDNQGYICGWARLIKNSDDRVYWAINTRRNVNNEDIGNQLRIGVNANGTRYVYVSEAAPWRSALGLAADSAWGSNKVARYKKQGNVVTVCGGVTTTDVQVPASTWTTLATLPSGYRPSENVYGTGLLRSDSQCIIRITSAGLVQAYVTAATGAVASGSSAYFNVSFVI